MPARPPTPPAPPDRDALAELTPEERERLVRLLVGWFVEEEEREAHLSSLRRYDR